MDMKKELEKALAQAKQLSAVYEDMAKKNPSYTYLAGLYQGHAEATAYVLSLFSK